MANEQIVYTSLSKHTHASSADLTPAIQSLSGKWLTKTNETWAVRRILNPNNAANGCLGSTIGKVVRFIARLFVGLFCSLFGGVLGALRHSWGTLSSKILNKAEDLEKHRESRLEDLFRASIWGTLITAFHYALVPDAFFSEGFIRSDEETKPRSKHPTPPYETEAKIAFFCCRSADDKEI